MVNRLPPEAFSFYVSLGPDRAYQSVAAKFGVSKTTVANHAKAENWQARVEEIERKAREQTDAHAVETVEAMNSRHLKMVKVIQAKALETLRQMPLSSALAAARALEASVKLERTIRGEPSDRTAVGIEDTVRREYARWFDSPSGEGVKPEAPLAEETTEEDDTDERTSVQ